MSRLIIVIGTTLPMALMNSIVPLWSERVTSPSARSRISGSSASIRLRHQFGKDRPAMDLVQRRIRRGQHLTTGVPEAKSTGQSGVVAIEQAPHGRREILDPGARLDQEFERADDEDLGPAISHTGACFRSRLIEGVRVAKHLGVQQQRSGDLLVHLVLSSSKPSTGVSDPLPEPAVGGIVVRHTRNSRRGKQTVTNNHPPSARSSVSGE